MTILRHDHAVFVHGESLVHRTPAVVKLTALLVVIVGVAATPREQVWALLVQAAIVVAVAIIAGIGPAVVVRRMLAAAPLLAVALALPFLGTGPRASVFGAALSIDGLWAAWAILAKGLVCLAAAIVVTATTTFPEIIEGLALLKFPSPIVGIASFMIRYVDVLAGEAGRTRIAMTARGYEPRWLWQAVPSAGAASVLFVRSYERGERTYDAMVTRGFTGDMPRLDRAATAPRAWVPGVVVAGAVTGVALAATLAGWGAGR